jgi:hypothetical protein
MPNTIILAVGFSVACCTAAFAQAENLPPAPIVTNPAPPAAQKRQAEVRDQQLQRRNNPRAARDPARPAIGPSTTQGLAQDAITRSNAR